jgi:hypothetical protein
MTAMTAAERWAALKAVAAAFTALADEAAQAVHEDVAATGAKSFETRFGAVVRTAAGTRVECVDPEALAAALPPEKVRTVPKDWALKEALAQVTVVAGVPVDVATGEVVGWAGVKATGGTLAWPASTGQREAKAAARRIVAGQIPVLLDGISQAELEAS